MVKHDENKDLKSFARIGKIHISDKTLKAPKSATIGIHLWGKIDFLTHYCGWHFLWDNNAGVGFSQSDKTDKKSSRAQKKAKKEPKLTDKTKKTKKK